MKSILDSSFRYTPSDQTDVRKTFAKIRREQLAQIGPEEEHAQTRSAAPVTKPIVLLQREKKDVHFYGR